MPASVLSDGTIRRLVDEGRIVIDPWDPRLVQPASVDLRLGDSFRVFHNHRTSAIDLREPPQGLTEEIPANPEDGFVIHPGEFCLGRTQEWVELPDDVVARIEGKSSLGRLGLIVHATAGFIDPGWKGTLTLELNNLTRVPIKLYPGLLIAQLSFMALDRPAERPYGSPELGSHYQGQVQATESRYMRQRPAAMLAVLMLAAEEAEPSKSPFYIMAGVLILFAVGLTAIGVARHETFPPSAGAARALMVVCALLVAGTMFTAVITA